MPGARTTPVDQAGPGWLPEDLADLADGLDYEVVDGFLVRRPDVTVPHGDLVFDLAELLNRQLPAGWKARSEVAVRMGVTLRRPDLGVMRAASRGAARQVGRNPAEFAMLAEVVSPGSERTDRVVKPVEYAAAGVPVFWRVELEPEPLLVVHRLASGAYQVVQRLTGAGRVALPFPVELDLPALLG